MQWLFSKEMYLKISVLYRFLRQVEVGHGPQEKGNIRKSRFDISVASEVTLSDDI